jgi:hypothetical protein
MRRLALVLGLIVLSGCADTSARLDTQAEQERHFMRGLYNSIENERTSAYADSPFGL